MIQLQLLCRIADRLGFGGPTNRVVPLNRGRAELPEHICRAWHYPARVFDKVVAMDRREVHDRTMISTEPRFPTEMPTKVELPPLDKKRHFVSYVTAARRIWSHANNGSLIDG